MKRASRTPLAALAFVLTLTTASFSQYKETVLVNFVGLGYGEYAVSVTRDASGNLYIPVLSGSGPNCDNGDISCGEIVRLAPTSSGTYSETINHTFVGGTDGFYPGALVTDGAGNIFGATYYGGISGTKRNQCSLGCGVIYELKPLSGRGWVYTVLYSFNNFIDGAYPVIAFVDAAGNLYGSAAGGAKSKGIIFELSPSSSGDWSETTLYSFSGATDGGYGNPTMIDASGNLFGVAPEGGNITSQCSYGCGYIFELSPTSSGSWTKTSLYAFNGPPDGAGPVTLIADGNGNLWGTTYDGGTGTDPGCMLYFDVPPGCGILFELSPNTAGGWTETVQHSFNYTLDGGYPSVLAIDASGNLYADLYLGGEGGYGAILKFSPGSGGGWQYTTLHDFANARGGGNPARMVLDSTAGDIYGATLTGGSKNFGLVYRLSPPAVAK